MRYNHYDVDFVFVKRVNLILADTLSSAHFYSSTGSRDERVQIMSVNTFDNIPDTRLNEIREATFGDTALQTLSVSCWRDGLRTNEKRPTVHCRILILETLSITRRIFL